MFIEQDDVIKKSYQICNKYFEQRRLTYNPAQKKSIQHRQKLLKRFFEQNLLLTEKIEYHTVWNTSVSYEKYSLQVGAFVLKTGVKIPVNLYTPQKKGNKVPAVIMPVGHYSAGKSTTEYVIMAKTLAACGCICLLYDPIGQGERDAQPDEKLILQLKDLYTVYRHMEMGDCLYEVGEQLAAWFVKESSIAIDYLLSREDVNAQQVGAIGQSGGGTNVQYLCAVEPRLSLAIPIHCTTTYALLLEQTIGDCEQTFFGCVEQGIEMADFYVPWAGKALCIIGGKEDYFNPKGALATYEEIKSVWQTLNADLSKLEFTLCGGGHFISKQVRAEVYRFVQKVFGLDSCKEIDECLVKIDCLTQEDRKQTQKAFANTIRKRLEHSIVRLESLQQLTADEQDHYCLCCDKLTVNLNETEMTVCGTNASETMRMVFRKKTGKTLWILGDINLNVPSDAAIAELWSNGMTAYQNHTLGYSVDAIHFYFSVLFGSPLWMQRAAQLERLLKCIENDYEKIVICSDGFLFQPVQILKAELDEKFDFSHVKQKKTCRPSDKICRMPIKKT